MIFKAFLLPVLLCRKTWTVPWPRVVWKPGEDEGPGCSSCVSLPVMVSQEGFRQSVPCSLDPDPPCCLCWLASIFMSILENLFGSTFYKNPNQKGKIACWNESSYPENSCSQELPGFRRTCLKLSLKWYWSLLFYWSCLFYKILTF